MKKHPSPSRSKTRQRYLHLFSPKARARIVEEDHPKPDRPYRNSMAALEARGALPKPRGGTL